MKSQRNRSLQTIHKLRQQETFIGREQQEALFQKNLMLDEELRVFIFNIFGQGGVGKTSLLRRFLQFAENAGAATIWNDETQKDILAVLENVAKQLEKQGHELKSFSKSYQVYLQRCQELTTDPDAPSGFADFVGDMAKIGIRMGHYTPIGAVLDLVNEDVVAKGVSSIANTFKTYLRHKLSNEEAYLVQKPIEVLTKHFLEDLWDASQKHMVALYFDTYEYTSGYLDDWLLECLNGYFGEIPANIVLVIAGRDQLERNRWEAFEGILAYLPLEPFTEEDARKYLVRKGIINEQVIKVILQLSNRLPLLIATLAVEHPLDPKQVGNPSGTAVERFLKWIEDPQQRQVAIDAALPRQLNRDVLGVLLEEKDTNVTRLFAWLKRMPFVNEHPNGWVYHDVVRFQMIHYKYIETPQEWSELHSRLADYYKRCQDNLKLDKQKQMLDATWQGLALEELYHRLSQAPQRYLPLALNGFLARFGLKEPVARQWAETIRQAGEELGVANLQRWGELLINGIADYEAQRFQEAALMFSELLNTTDLEEEWRLRALTSRSALFFNSKQYLQALADVDQVLEYDPNNGLSLFLRWMIYIILHRNDEAHAAQERLQEGDPEFANAIDRMFTEYAKKLKERSKEESDTN